MHRAVVAILLLAPGCVAPSPLLTPAESALAIAAALRTGQLEQAIAAAARARLRHPDDGTVAAWSSVVADCLWQDQRAADELAAAARAEQRAGAPTAAMRGRLGELLFLHGRWGEATAPLQTAAVAGGDSAVRYAALAKLAAALPYRRQQVGPLATEQPLLAGELPEFVCSIGGAQRVFAIDSGTSMTTLSASLANEVRVAAVTPAGVVVDGTGREVAVSLGLLPAFAIGDVGLGTIPIAIVSDAALALRDAFSGPERPPAGVLGLDLLALFRLTIDPGRRTVVFEVSRGVADADSVQCVRADGRCLLPVTVDDTRLWFALDTGASHSSLTVAGLRALPLGEARATPAFRRVHAAGGGSVSVREVRELLLRVATTRFGGVALPVIDRPAGATFPLHGVLGNDLLRRCRLTLDRGRLSLEVPA
ncbi:MAG: aspartyl protease family protein [Planctomycetes bacterium]|nr:aspartyl protease family protein [Planctomycetota bacterium]